MASSLISTSSRSLKADDATNGIICSPYTDVHIVNFSYTIDTPSNDEETIRNAIGEFESRSLNWLAGSLLPCNGRRGLVDALEENGDYVGPAFESESFVANNEEVLKKEGQRYLRPDMFRELGIAGLKSWPDDILSTSSNCFPTNNSSNTCTVVFGTVSAYLNPTSSGTISEEQKKLVENNIRYQIMTFMRSGLVESQINAIDYVRYLSPIVAMSDNGFRLDPASQPYLHFSQSTDSSGMTVTQSILIIAACFTIIGAIGLVLSVKMLIRHEEDYSSVKQQHTVEMDEDDSMIPQTSGRQEHVCKERGYVWSTIKKERGNNMIKENNPSEQFVTDQHVDELQNGREEHQSDTSYGTNANMSATMRRVIVTKKVPVTRARSGDMINLGSVMEEDNEEAPPSRLEIK